MFHQLKLKWRSKKTTDWKHLINGGDLATGGDSDITHDTKNGSAFKNYEDKKCETEEGSCSVSCPFRDPHPNYSCDSYLALSGEEARRKYFFT